MKAIVRVTAPQKALGVNIESSKAEKIKAILTKENAEYISADSSDGGTSVGKLVGISSEECISGKNDEITDEIILFSGFDGKKLNHILSKMRSEGCTVELKAVITPSNKSWSLSKLAEEISAEHKLMHGIKEEAEQ